MPNQFTGPISVEKRLLSIVDKSSGCWIRVGKTDKGGYTHIKVNKRTRSAHRTAYELWVGKIPKGLMVCHSCDRPACINPDHLFLGTAKDNMDDRNKKGRQARGQNHGNAVLTQKLVEEIRSKYVPGVNPSNRGYSAYKLAKEYGVSYSTVNRLVNNKSYSILQAK